MNVASLLAKPPAAPTPTPTPAPAPPAAVRRLTVTVASSASRAAFARGLVLHVVAPAAGRVNVSATVPASVGRRLKLHAARTTLRATGGTAAAKTVVVARGSATAKAAGTLTVRLVPTAAARRRVAKLKGATLTLKITQGAATATARVRMR